MTRRNAPTLRDMRGQEWWRGCSQAAGDLYDSDVARGLWKEIKKGQDLECIRCYQGRKGGIHSGLIYCGNCELYRPATAFAKGAEQILMTGADGLVQCEQCEYGRVAQIWSSSTVQRVRASCPKTRSSQSLCSHGGP